MKNALWMIALIAALLVGCGDTGTEGGGNDEPQGAPEPASGLMGEAHKFLAALESATDEATGEAARKQIAEIAERVKTLKAEGATLDADQLAELKKKLMAQLRRLSASHGKLAIEANNVRKALGL